MMKDGSRVEIVLVHLQRGKYHHFNGDGTYAGESNDNSDFVG
jgi:hypothetical protein